MSPPINLELLPISQVGLAPKGNVNCQVGLAAASWRVPSWRVPSKRVRFRRVPVWRVPSIRGYPPRGHPPGGSHVGLRALSPNPNPYLGGHQRAAAQVLSSALPRTSIHGPSQNSEPPGHRGERPCQFRGDRVLPQMLVHILRIGGLSGFRGSERFARMAYFFPGARGRGCPSAENSVPFLLFFILLLFAALFCSETPVLCY